MREHGMDVTVIASPGRPLEDVAESEGVNTIAVPMPAILPPRHSVVLIRLTRILRRLRPDIVHCATPQASFLGGMASSIAGVPVRVMTLHGIGTEAVTGRMRPVFHFLERLTCRSMQRIYCVGGSLRSQALELQLVPADKLRVLAGGTCNGIEIERFSRTPDVQRRSDALHERLRLPAEAPVIGFVGRMVRFKGVPDLIAAFKRLKADFPGLILLLVGPFENYERLDPELYAEITQDPQIVPTGFLEDTPAVYSLMNVLSLPSYREGYGYVLMEAAAMQVPTVATRIVGCVDAVVDGVTGTLVPPGNVDCADRAAAVLSHESRTASQTCNGVSGRFATSGRSQFGNALYQEYMELLDKRDEKHARCESETENVVHESQIA